ncbi:MAG: pilus assembly protein PilM, partial [Thermoguttaceae bacterium]|nr:pilus assembly protein PilM [Thermoguttaceae bacterium]
NIDCIQGAPVAVYNAFVHDQLDYDALLEQDINSLNDFDVILNIGTDTTDVVITNGVIIWLRNITIGGNMFTKALTKSLKLTFSNAEHIKRNAATAQDPKAVILAMKPVFNDMLSEIDRSIKYYCSLNKNARIRKIYALGNAMKLPGLRQFLAKSHGLDVIVPSSFPKMRGAEVLSNAQFKDNLSSFAVAYGLVLQMLGEAPISINLVPKDVMTDRLINSKKPWALIAASLLLIGLTIQYISSIRAYNTVENPLIASAFSNAKSVNEKSKDLIDKADSAAKTFKTVDTIGQNLTSNVEGRLTWLEILRAINASIPADPPTPEILQEGVSAIKREAIEKQNRVYIDNVEVQDLDDLDSWFELAKRWYYIDDIEAAAFSIDAQGKPILGEDGKEIKPEVSLEDTFTFFPAPVTKGGSSKKGTTKKKKKKKSTSTSSSSSSSSSTSKSSKKKAVALSDFEEGNDKRIDLIPGPSGSGRIVQIRGYHYHNSDNANDPERGAEYIRRTLLYNLKHGAVELPLSLGRQQDGESGTERVTFKELGIYFPIMVDPGVIDEKYRLLDPQAAAEARNKLMNEMIKRQPGTSSGNTMGGMGMMGGTMGGTMGGMTGGMGGSTMRSGRSSSSRSTGGMGMSGGMTGGGMGMPGMSSIADSLSKDKILNLRRFDYIIQFVWIETPPSTRDARKKEALEKALAKNKKKSGSAVTEEEDEENVDAGMTAGNETSDVNTENEVNTENTNATDSTPTTPADNVSDDADNSTGDDNVPADNAVDNNAAGDVAPAEPASENNGE